MLDNYIILISSKYFTSFLELGLFNANINNNYIKVAFNKNCVSDINTL